MRRTAFTLPVQLRDQYRQHVAGLAGYGQRGKSRWIREAIEMLFADDPGLAKVGMGRDLETRDVIDAVILDEQNEALIAEAYRVLRRQYPEWEGIQGDVIRAAIGHRLGRETGA